MAGAPDAVPGRVPEESVMATCPECDADIDVDEFDVERGDVLSCPECGSNLEVAGLAPLELVLVGDEDDDDEDFDEDDDEELEDEDDEEEEAEEE
jgi:alpha-aminoadipate carrier protein LysW